MMNGHYFRMKHIKPPYSIKPYSPALYDKSPASIDAGDLL